MKKFKLSDYLPAIIAGIVAVEQIIASAPGQTKKQIVLTAIQAGVAVGQQIPETHVQAIGSVIDGIVGVLNKAGVFSSAPKVAEPVVIG